MHTRLATALSILGVIGAGTIATAVNTSVLSGGPDDSPQTPVVAPMSALDDGALGAATSEPMSDSTVASIVEATVPPEVTTPATSAPAVGEHTTFNVGDAATVTVAVTDGRLELISADAHDGWTPGETIVGDNAITLSYQSSVMRVRLQVTVVDGKATASVESSNLDGSGASSDTIANGGGNGVGSPQGAAPVAAVPGAPTNGTIAAAPPAAGAVAAPPASPTTSEVVGTTAAPPTTTVNSTVADRDDDDGDDSYERDDDGDDSYERDDDHDDHDDSYERDDDDHDDDSYERDDDHDDDDHDDDDHDGDDDDD